jgi:hypothetical protein
MSEQHGDDAGTSEALKRAEQRVERCVVELLERIEQGIDQRIERGIAKILENLGIIVRVDANGNHVDENGNRI